MLRGSHDQSAVSYWRPNSLCRFPPCPLIPRPHLLALLDAGLHRQFTLVSAPAGSGKTALLSTWVQSHPSSNSHMAWATLDVQDNQPRRFWEYVLTALGQREPGIIA